VVIGEEGLGRTPAAAVRALENPVLVIFLRDGVKRSRPLIGGEAARILILKHIVAGALAVDRAPKSGKVVVLIVNTACDADKANALSNATCGAPNHSK
jgi:hypothetical protein